MDDEMNFEELEKRVSDIAVISENANIYKCIIKWNISKLDFKKVTEGKEIASNWFSISSAFSACKLIINYKNALAVYITFKNKVPEFAYIEGKIALTNDVSESQKFVFTGREVKKEMEIGVSSLNPHEFMKFNMNDINDDLIVKCSMKVSVKEVNCTVDTYTAQCTESKCHLLYKNLSVNYFSDLTIYAEGCQIKVHKPFLSELPFFKQLFDKNKSVAYLELTGIDVNILRSVINYLYTQEIPELNFKLACEFYVVSNDLQLFDLKNICSSYLGANLTPENVFIVFTLSVEGDDISLKKECIKFIKDSNFEQLVANSVVF